MSYPQWTPIDLPKRKVVRIYTGEIGSLYGVRFIYTDPNQKLKELIEEVEEDGD